MSEPFKDPFEDPLLAERALESPSGFQNAMRYRLVEWRDGTAILEMQIAAQHMNRRGVVHGGLLAALIDTACGFAGTHVTTPGEQPPVATLTLTTSFLAPARRGPLRTVGTRKGGGRRIYFAVGEVFDGDGTLVAFGEASYRISERKADGHEAA